MKLNFKKVHLHGFLSFGDAEVNLNDNGFVSVQGINERTDDNSASNGSGKSSIFESITWCLTGSTTRGTKDIVNIHTDDGCYVELWFECDGKEYHLLRSRNSAEYKTNLKIYIDGVDVSGKGIKDSQALLEQYLPDLTAQLLGSVIILGQGLPQRFSNNSPSGRKEILEKLSKSDFMIEDLKTRIADRKNTLSDELRNTEDTIVADNSKKSTNEELLLSYKDKLNNIGTTEAFDRTIEDNKLQLENLEKQKLEFQANIDKLSAEYSKNNEEYSKLDLERLAELSKIDTTYNTLISECNAKITDISSKMSALKLNYPNIYDDSELTDLSFENLTQQLTTLETDKAQKAEQLHEIEIAGKSVATEQSEQLLARREKYQEEISHVDNEISVLSANIKLIEKTIFDKKNIKDVCPTCGQKLPNVIKPDTSADEKELEASSNNLTLANSKREALVKTFESDNQKIVAECERKKQKLREDYIALKNTIDSTISLQIVKLASNIFAKHQIELTPYQTQLQNLNQNIKLEKDVVTQKYDKLLTGIRFEMESIRQQSNELNSKLNNSVVSIGACQRNIDTAEQEKAHFYERKQELEVSIKNIEETITKLAEKILYNTNERENIQKHLDVLTKFTTAVTRDFRGYLLSNVIEYINRRAKEYSLEVFNTDKISFALDGNDIDISYDGKSMESLSGGERQKVDLIVQFAIRDMLCKFLGFSSSIIVLDEIFDQLDFTGCQKMIDLITHKLSDINSVYVISHHQDLQIPCDSELVVVKNKDGISGVKK